MSELKHQLMLNKDRSWVPCYLKSEADAYIRHHKYKRCLAMVETCIYKKELDEDRYHMHGGHGWTNYRFWDKWQKTWLELAEKFKEAK